MQLTKEQRTFIVEKYFQAKSFQPVIQSFQEHFPERQSPTKMTIWKNVTRYRTEGTSLNVNKRSIRRKKKMFEFFKEHLQKIRKSLQEKDGAPAHRTVAVTEKLNELFGNRIIALNHRIEWPPRSSDLTPCDFFLWGHLKSKVYSSPLRDTDELKQKIENEANLLQGDDALVRRVMA
ncbi:Protein of unknown function DUF4817 [Trinorchestia longiramus]|nr:Protein of unknown function DUF4817 [Trinorchestia longiramus]